MGLFVIVVLLVVRYAHSKFKKEELFYVHNTYIPPLTKFQKVRKKSLVPDFSNLVFKWYFAISFEPNISMTLF